MGKQTKVSWRRAPSHLPVLSLAAGIDRILEALGTPIAGLETTSETKLQKKRFDSPSASPVCFPGLSSGPPCYLLRTIHYMETEQAQ